MDRAVLGVAVCVNCHELPGVGYLRLCVVSVQGHVDSRAWLKQEIHSMGTTERREIVLDTNYMAVMRRVIWWYLKKFRIFSIINIVFSMLKRTENIKCIPIVRIFIQALLSCLITLNYRQQLRNLGLPFANRRNIPEDQYPDSRH
jgi:hypothetical protein